MIKNKMKRNNICFVIRDTRNNYIINNYIISHCCLKSFCLHLKDCGKQKELQYHCTSQLY